jgi:hypothetical protein
LNSPSSNNNVINVNPDTNVNYGKISGGSINNHNKLNNNNLNNNLNSPNIIEIDKVSDISGNSIGNSSTNSTNTNNNNLNIGSISPLKSKRTKQLETILSQKMINLNDLKTFAWKGVPFENSFLRAEVWKFLLGYYPINTELKDNLVKRKRQEYLETCLIYNSLLENPSKNMNDSEMKIYKQISVDVPRTMPEYKLFSLGKIRQMMLRLLYVWSMRHPASGYVQGFNDLVTPFFVIFITQYRNCITSDIESTLELSEDLLYDLGEEVLLEIEADSYWCFTKMMDRIQTNYTHNQPGLTRMVHKMEEIIKIVDMDLFKHLEQFEITFMQFSFRWMNCYLMREFSLKLIIRLWDTYFSEDDAFNTFHLYVCACLLLNFSEKIKKMNEYQETMMFLQNLPMANWTLEEIEVLLAKAYQVHTMYGKFIKDKK